MKMSISHIVQFVNHKGGWVQLTRYHQPSNNTAPAVIIWVIHYTDLTLCGVIFVHTTTYRFGITDMCD